MGTTEDVVDAAIVVRRGELRRGEQRDRAIVGMKLRGMGVTAPNEHHLSIPILLEVGRGGRLALEACRHRHPRRYGKAHVMRLGGTSSPRHDLPPDCRRGGRRRRRDPRHLRQPLLRPHRGRRPLALLPLALGQPAVALPHRIPQPLDGEILLLGAQAGVSPDGAYELLELSCAGVLFLGGGVLVVFVVGTSCTGGGGRGRRSSGRSGGGQRNDGVRWNRRGRGAGRCRWHFADFPLFLLSRGGGDLLPPCLLRGHLPTPVVRVLRRGILRFPL
mmetsp:Transcript_41228/g.87852  ORF Transcript_41228/g.87852 Transcript_41228/m.87852 type:complete len:274 (-) Transcript_41228:624-1445(-)